MTHSPKNTCALDCCECGVVVGIEGAQRGTLLLPCQHVLHMGCVEFIKRRGKLLIGMDTADLLQDDEGKSAVTPHNGNGNSTASETAASNTSRQMHGCCVCPACYSPITHIIPLFLRSDDDPVKPEAAATFASDAAGGMTVEEEYKRVHMTQKRVLLRLRGLCEQRRRMTELTHSCASLHEQRARHLAEVEKEERCFPGLLRADEDGKDAPTSKGAANTHNSSSTAPAGIPLENMGITELELYMAQITPRLLRTQADLRKERQLVERQTKRLSALRTHYHSTKELHALDAEIAQRQTAATAARVRSHVSTAPARLPTHQEAAISIKSEDLVPTLTSSASSAEVVQSTPTATEAPVSSCDGPPIEVPLPARKRQRGEVAIDVDDEPLAEVVEILSNDGSCSDEEDEDSDVTVLPVSGDGSRDTTRRSGTGTASSGGSGDVLSTPCYRDVEVVEGVPVSTDEASTYEAPYLIPCYVRPAAGSANSSPKTPGTAVTHHHVRLLPRREDRLWQPSLRF